MNGLNACVNYVTEKNQETDIQTTIADPIVVIDTDEESNIDLDVAFAHPWSSEVLSKSAEEDGFAVSAREEQKRKKYAKLALSGRGTTNPTLIPLVFEHFGRWRQKAERYLNTLPSRARDCERKRNHSEFVCY